MIWRLRTLLGGLSHLSDPELVRDLGERRRHLAQIAFIRAMAKGVRIDANVVLSGFAAGRLKLGTGCTVSSGTVLAFGDELNGPGTISVGDSTWIGQYNNLRAGGGSITIGRDCLISQFCTLAASNHGLAAEKPIRLQPPAENRRGIIIEDDVWLGAGVTVLPGVTIHSGAVIGAGSVVLQTVPPGEIHAGIPSRRVAIRGDRTVDAVGLDVCAINVRSDFAETKPT